MFNSLDAHEGSDFDHVRSQDMKNKLPPWLVAFWEVLESAQLDIIMADGHPLGRTFKFKINVSKNPGYKEIFSKVKVEPLYSEYDFSITDPAPDHTIMVTIEPSAPTGTF
ncbi:MAG: hypothetical protein AABZ14_04800 [Candidatus Margulisiibacteriota bacterium]